MSENEPYQLILGRLRGTGMSWTHPLLGAAWVGSKFVSVFLGVSSWLLITSTLGPGGCRVCRWIPSFPHGLCPHNQGCLVAHGDASLQCIFGASFSCQRFRLSTVRGLQIELTLISENTDQNSNAILNMECTSLTGFYVRGGRGQHLTLPDCS